VSVSALVAAMTARRYFRTSAMGPRGVVFSEVLREETRATGAWRQPPNLFNYVVGTAASPRLSSCDSNDAS